MDKISAADTLEAKLPNNLPDRFLCPKSAAEGRAVNLFPKLLLSGSLSFKLKFMLTHFANNQDLSEVPR